MALSRAGCCRVLWRLGPGPGPAAGFSRARRPLELPLPPRWAPRSLVCRLSTKAGSRSILTTLASKAKLVSGRYERFLERTFPRFYVLYTTFTKGIQALFLEVKEIRKIKSKMSHQRLSVQQLPYREMERLRQAVPQGCDQGHSHRNYCHPALRQLLGHRPDVFLPAPAPDPLLLDPAPAGRVPGRLRRRPARLVPARADQLSPGGTFPAGAAATGRPAGALRRGAARPTAARGPALRPEKFVCGVSAGSEQAPRVPRESPEPGPVPDPSLAGLFPEASPAEPRPGDPAPGPCHAAPGRGAAVRGGAESGLLPPWLELHASRRARVQSVAGAVAGALLQAASF
ncbi:LETM1 domain-containing protein 1 isoform X2 [Falco naumanni]|uniref:LETM1 domain-containing protein 1 isoform X2 n=1 Tax=Falco naumanni TaxID=148594 RepID=UPI001ADEA459|nr:LETM1 domain-containing protein 1 isoform X2 [Falco naumanni]